MKHVGGVPKPRKCGFFAGRTLAGPQDMVRYGERTACRPHITVAVHIFPLHNAKLVNLANKKSYLSWSLAPFIFLRLSILRPFKQYALTIRARLSFAITALSFLF
jgi:hypothetical protein